MKQEYKIKVTLVQVLCSVLICMGMIVVKFILKEENLITEIYNYLVSDIVFRH